MSCENRTTTENKKFKKKSVSKTRSEEGERAGCYSLTSYWETSVDQYSLKSPRDKWGEGCDPERRKKREEREKDATEVPLRRTADGGN